VIQLKYVEMNGGLERGIFVLKARGCGTPPKCAR